jgi:hypothetical protein
MAMAGKNGDVQEGKFDKNEQVGFKQAESGAHEQLIGQYLKGTSDNSVLQAGADVQKFGVGKDGQFKYASPEQLAAMDDKTFMGYVKAHDDYTKQQVEAHPEKLQKIVASYGARLDDDMTKQTYQQVQAFYGSLGKAVDK